jgi:hypothetical protein
MSSLSVAPAPTPTTHATSSTLGGGPVGGAGTTGQQQQQQQQQQHRTLNMRIDDECRQLLLDIRRVGGADDNGVDNGADGNGDADDGGGGCVKFGRLFDDPAVEQYYEALVGTLKSAKKRGLITFRGQMLLKGVHDSVVIRIVTAGSGSTAEGGGTSERSKLNTNHTAPPSSSSSVSSQSSLKPISAPVRKWKRPVMAPSSMSAGHVPRQPQPYQGRSWKPKPKPIIPPPQAKPQAKQQQQQHQQHTETVTDASTVNSSSSMASTASSATVTANVNAKPNMISPTSSSAYHLRGFSNTVSKSATSRRKQSTTNTMSHTSAAGTTTTPGMAATATPTVSMYQSHKNKTNNHNNSNSSSSAQSQSTAQSQSQPSHHSQSQSQSQSTHNSQTESASCHSRHEQELLQLLLDIRRIGSSGIGIGGANTCQDSTCCRFGDLFDDPRVEQYYEALIGTLRSAKKRGLITFKGQMLLKGMHDKVVIRITDSTESKTTDDPPPEKKDNTKRQIILRAS